MDGTLTTTFHGFMTYDLKVSRILMKKQTCDSNGAGKLLLFKIDINNRILHAKSLLILVSIWVCTGKCQSKEKKLDKCQFKD